MSFALRIAGRYLRSKQRRGFISYTTYISVFGVFLGVAALIISLSVLNGFERIVKQKFFEFDGQIHILPEKGGEIEGYEEIAARIRERPDIVGVMPFVVGKGMLVTETKQTGVVIKGVDGKHMDKALSLSEKIEYGSGCFLRDDSLLNDDPVVIVGNLLCDRTELDRGDRVNLVSARITGGLFSTPPTRSVFMDGEFSTGIFEYDNLYVLVSLKTAQKLMSLKKGVSGLVVKTNSYERIETIAADLKEDLPDGLTLKSWYELHRNLFASMKIERLATFIVLSLIIVVAAFNIISSLIMMVMEKRREIGIIRSMGCSTAGIVRIFLLEGMIVGTIGLVFGLLAGYGLCFAQAKYQFIKLPGDVFIIDVLPVVIRIHDFIFVVVVTTVIYIAASLYPAWKASKLNPMEALRY